MNFVAIGLTKGKIPFYSWNIDLTYAKIKAN